MASWDFIEETGILGLKSDITKPSQRTGLINNSLDELWLVFINVSACFIVGASTTHEVCHIIYATTLLFTFAADLSKKNAST